MITVTGIECEGGIAAFQEQGPELLFLRGIGPQGNLLPLAHGKKAVESGVGFSMRKLLL